MLRKIIRIDEDKCNGCGACAAACHEGAIGMVDGKARLLRDDYCDGLGNCLPVCPTAAISFEEREAAAFDESAVQAAQAKSAEKKPSLACGCPGTMAKAIKRETVRAEIPAAESRSELRQWPVQIKLVPVNAPYFEGANLLIAADCTAYAFAGMHDKFMKGRVTLIGCPKLDEVEYADKLAAILRNNDIQSVTVVRMEVPCCGGIVHAVTEALKRSGKVLPYRVTIISTEGRIVSET